jgi:tRNA(Ile)-lysidine synthase
MRSGPRHPILGLRRRETRALCLALELDPVVDPTNDDPAYRRNRIRHEVLPLLEQVAERDVAAVIARHAELLADDADLLDRLAVGIDPRSVEELRLAPEPLARRALRDWLRSAEGHPPSAAAIDRVMAVVRLEAKAAEVGGGVLVRRSAGQLHIEH